MLEIRSNTKRTKECHLRNYFETNSEFQLESLRKSDLSEDKIEQKV